MAIVHISAAACMPSSYSCACRITFQLREYVQRQRAKHGAFFAEQPFYPEASVTFQITPQQTREHFHIPLTWSPYGYSTYRGS